VLQQAPATWYTSVREVYKKALQWETNNAHRVESHKAEPNQPWAKVFAHVKRDSRPNRDFPTKRDSRDRDTNPKRKSSFSEGRHKRARTEEREYKILKELYEQRLAANRCWKCGLEGHRASVCKNGYCDEHGKKIQ
jgi:hypothetical protein